MQDLREKETKQEKKKQTMSSGEEGKDLKGGMNKEITSTNVGTTQSRKP